MPEPPKQLRDERRTVEPAADAVPPKPEASTQQTFSMEELLADAEPEPVSLEDAQLRAVLEAIVYVAEEPLTLAQLAAALQQPAERIRSAARPACCGIRQARARRDHPRSRRRIQDGHQGRSTTTPSAPSSRA